jgi:hypothetical protein
MNSLCPGVPCYTYSMKSKMTCVTTTKTEDVTSLRTIYGGRHIVENAFFSTSNIQIHRSFFEQRTDAKRHTRNTMKQELIARTDSFDAKQMDCSHNEAAVARRKARVCVFVS